ncbi:hypothetical protein [Spirabiliibacterium falconis]|uniref:hypothetical protein n=1 Tax=Spirabiliibacterium falconis TaxID=572023 RepID=UPI001AAD8352|nr:hypothetical protein [Spirabiliibacterium falconis]MBE2894547.1 hypothetical protein [Spirabiliibacterium falconis]
MAGYFFSDKARELGKQYNTHFWVNTLYDPDGKAGLRSGGRGDEMAIFAKLPADVYGFWAEQGVTIFQTDEPEILLNWLDKNHYRIPYDK